MVEVKGVQGCPWFKFSGRGGSLSRDGGFVIEAGRGFRCWRGVGVSWLKLKGRRAVRGYRVRTGMYLFMIPCTYRNV